MLTNTTVYILLPELILVLLATDIYVGGAFTSARYGWDWLAATALLLAAVALYNQQEIDPVHGAVIAADAKGAFSGPLAVDLFGQTLRWLALGVGLGFVAMCGKNASEGLAPEFMGSLLLIVAGLMLVAMSSDLVLMFLGLELISIPTYVILYLGRSDAGGQEAATKYFFLSILSSALMLYGFSFLYGAAGGSTDLHRIYQSLHAAQAGAGDGLAALGKLALVFIVAGLGFRLTAVPFHFYAPDVYQGTSHPNAGLLAVVPKLAALAALVRIVMVAMPGLERVGWQLALALSILTMSVGNMLALWQSNVRRLLAYSSVAHAGYMLIGLTVGFAVAEGTPTAKNMDGVGATIFYVIVYAAATMGSFATLTYLSSQTKQVDGVDDLAGVARSNPIAAACLAVCMFSLTGLPPLAGFWGKFTLLTGALGVSSESSVWPWFVGLVIVAVVNAAISAGYYLRVVSVMYFRPALTTTRAEGGTGAALCMGVCALLVIGLGFYPAPLMQQSNTAAEAARATFGAQPATAEPPPALGSLVPPGDSASVRAADPQQTAQASP